MKQKKRSKIKPADAKEVESRLYYVFEDVFNVERSELKPALIRTDIEDWDSLGHVRLITAVEEEFGFRIPIPIAAKFKNIRSIIEYLSRKKKKDIRR